SGIRVCDATIPDGPSVVGNTGALYSTGYRARCSSIARISSSLASEYGTVRIQVTVSPFELTAHVRGETGMLPKPNYCSPRNLAPTLSSARRQGKVSLIVLGSCKQCPLKNDWKPPSP